MNKKILAFADVHLGIKSYSTQQTDGLVTAEHEARVALNEILERSSQDDIDMILIAGDFYHTNHPTSANVAYGIEWFSKMDTLGKPLIVIPGNHDVSTYSHSMAFLKKMEDDFNYITCVDSFKDGVFIEWHDWSIKVVPYVPDISLKDKNKTAHEYFTQAVNNSTGNTIIMGHITESAARRGSEVSMLSRYVDTVDVSNVSTNDKIIALLGHIHMHQIYTKSNGIKVVYPGSLFYHDFSDIKQSKGYVTIDTDGTIEFEAIKKIRRFIHYSVTSDQNVVEFLKSIRTGTNNVVFVTTNNDSVDEEELADFLKTRNSTIGWVKKNASSNNIDISIATQSDSTPYEQFSSFITEYLKKEGELHEFFNDIIQAGTIKLQEVLNV